MTRDEDSSAVRVHGMLTAYLQTQVLISALQFGIFEQLEGRSLDVHDLSSRIGVPERPTRALLIALSGLGLLSEDGLGYRNTPEASRYLVRRNPEFMGDFAEHQSAHFANSVELPAVIRSNSSITKRVLKEGYSDQGSGAGEGAAGRERLIGAMRVSARLQADPLAKRLDLLSGSTLVDLGCGSGDYSIAIARRHPEIRVIAVDYPSISEIASRNVAVAGLEDRIEFQPGDIMKDLLPECDAVLLSHVLDGYGRDRVRHLVSKIFDELRGNGRLFVHSHMPDVSKGLFPNLFGVILLINTEEGEVYEAVDLMEIIRGAGFSDLRTQRVSFLSGLVSAVRPSLEGQSDLSF